MIGSQRILGADLYANNASGNNYLPSSQVSTGRRCKVHKVVVSNLGADVYLWIFDTAAGGAGSAAPRVVEYCPSGVCTTLDLTDGFVFTSGIYWALSTTKPTDATTTVTTAGNNAAIVDVSYSLQ